MDFIPMLVDAVGVLPAIEVPDVNPDLNGPFTGAAMRVVNLAAGIATIACLLGVLITGILLGVANLSDRHKHRAWQVLGGALLGVMVAGSATALMTFVGGIPLVG